MQGNWVSKWFDLKKAALPPTDESAFEVGMDYFVQWLLLTPDVIVVCTTIFFLFLWDKTGDFLNRIMWIIKFFVDPQGIYNLG